MKKGGLPNTCFLDRDAPAMKSAITALLEQRIAFHRPSLYQLKIGKWNFYPAKGTIIRDGQEAAEDERGLDAFIGKAAFGRTAAHPDAASIPV